MRHLKSRGLSGVRMFISDACLGLVESLGDFYPDALWQRCVVHFYRNVFSYVPRGKVEETLTYYGFPSTHWRRIRTNNPMERIIREIRRRSRVVRAFPDGQSALMLCAARLRHVSGTKWGSRRYLDMDLLREMDRKKEVEVG